jgi:hypothetical protein
VSAVRRKSWDVIYLTLATFIKLASLNAQIAIRSKISILQSPMESYRLGRQYNDSWIHLLRAKAATAKNRVPLDLQNMLEFRNLLEKISVFALTEIEQQILQARRK